MKVLEEVGFYAERVEEVLLLLTQFTFPIYHLNGSAALLVFEQVLGLVVHLDERTDEDKFPSSFLNDLVEVIDDALSGKVCGHSGDLFS